MTANPQGHSEAERFLDLACIHYGPDITRGPESFAEAAALLAQQPGIAQSSLHCAAAAGDAQAVAEILAARPQALDETGGPHGWTPLMYAGYARLPGVSTLATARVLIQAGADPNAHEMMNGIYRFSVLTGVFGDGEGGLVRQPPHPEMERFARALLEAGANPNDSQGAYNRSFSADDTHLRLMLEYGLKDSDPSDWWLDAPDKDPNDHRTLHFQLIIALRFGFADRARLLIEHGVDIDTPDNNYYPTYTVGYAPYQVALMRGMPEIAALIAERGGSTPALGPYEAFQAACMRGDLAAARSMAAHLGTNPAHDYEMLCEAAGAGMLPAVECLLALGIDPSRPGTATALHIAAFKGHLPVIRALIAAGADTTLRDPTYHTPPFIHAMHAYQEGAVELLMEHPMDIFAAAAMGRLDHIKAALAQDAALVNARFKSVRTGGGESHPNDWATPLWYAVVNGREDSARLLLSRGADPLMGNDSGETIAELARGGPLAWIAD
ncbi:ankyrin repeat domain-containing protein [Alphaproteobacteria bacterium KMM 3653]|uniref:Ankyrin repeat domain-containing protein n=1 Tax=Harenicola maris TaxID=2841044 RepID=A0AAP2G459_9RHOB|nr:ankyrin repeat domain-containing protein [Harenicola maris]